MNNRLTEKTPNGYAMPRLESDKVITHIESIINALGKYEDLEESIAKPFKLDLITLLRALDEGIWVKRTPLSFPKGIPNTNIVFDIYNECFILPEEIESDDNSIKWETSERYFFVDYGKTWALTKEELL